MTSSTDRAASRRPRPAAGRRARLRRAGLAAARRGDGPGRPGHRRGPRRRRRRPGRADRRRRGTGPLAAAGPVLLLHRPGRPDPGPLPGHRGRRAGPARARAANSPRSPAPTPTDAGGPSACRSRRRRRRAPGGCAAGASSSSTGRAPRTWSWRPGRRPAATCSWSPATARASSAGRCETLDPTRGQAIVSFDGAAGTPLTTGGGGPGPWRPALDVALVVLAAEQVGGAAACLDMAVEYAQDPPPVQPSDRRLPGDQAQAR